jgi:hypothetical protein
LDLLFATHFPDSLLWKGVWYAPLPAAPLVRLNEGSVYAQGYADDICLLAVGKFPNTVSGLIQWPLHTVELWCGGLGLSVNPD